ncbi:glycosyltransferase family A protein [Synechococcus sp. 1G10]|uniref:glycosyltransferase family A protein n=1 Tax=Synechococcus sp. 1G10 TaxID=2025605 RepID=UPI001303E71D|nr:glycosyltransferase family A protein [Synechococcus sp. 1G10]
MSVLAKLTRLLQGHPGTWSRIRFSLYNVPVQLLWWKVGRCRSRPGVVSVVIPTYKRHRMLREALASVFRQTLSNWEVLVVADGHDPVVEQIVASFGDPRLSYRPSPHVGLYGNHQRNLGILAARGEYFLFLDDDNLLEPHAVEMMCSGFRSTATGYVICPIIHGGRKQFPGQGFCEGHVDTLNFMLTRQALYLSGPWKWSYSADFHLIAAAERRFPGEFVDGPPIGVHRK